MFCVSIYYFYLNWITNNSSFSLSSNNESDKFQPVEKDECELEWLKLNENVFIRRTLVFYYDDLKKIRIYLERNKDYNYKYMFAVKVVSISNLKWSQYLI